MVGMQVVAASVLYIHSTTLYNSHACMVYLGNPNFKRYLLILAKIEFSIYNPMVGLQIVHLKKAKCLVIICLLYHCQTRPLVFMVNLIFSYLLLLCQSFSE